MNYLTDPGDRNEDLSREGQPAILLDATGDEIGAAITEPLESRLCQVGPGFQVMDNYLLLVANIPTPSGATTCWGYLLRCHI